MRRRKAMKVGKKTIEKEEAYLRQVSKPIDFFKDDWKKSYYLLNEFCKQESNVYAMAAVQIGIPLRMIYLKNTTLEEVDSSYNEAKVLINPSILKQEGLTYYWEACASCLDYTGLVGRPYKIELSYYDMEKRKHRETFVGFAAIVLAHEMDHLDGILHIDVAERILQMNQEERKAFRRLHPYKIIRKEGQYNINRKKE